MNLSRRALLSTLPLLPAAGRLRAQQPAAASAATFSVDVEVVEVFATVRDQRGRIAGNLTAGDFLLDEEGRPQTIRYFSRESDLPLTLGLLVDTSVSQERVLGRERAASRRFLDRMLRQERDRAFLIHFDREVELLADLTSSRQKLENALGALKVPRAPQVKFDRSVRRGEAPPTPLPDVQLPRGSTHLYDAVQLASDELMKKQKGRKALAVLTDGVDVGSVDSLAEAIASAQRADTLVYSILFADPQAYSPGLVALHPERFDGRGWLGRIARETGARLFEVSDEEPIETIYGAIEEDLRNQYVIGYTPQPRGAPGEYRHIHLAAKAAGLTVRAREGYYPASK